MNLRTHLLAMNFDAAASPVVRFRDVPRTHVAGRVPCGWGFAWYPEGDTAAAIAVDPNSTGDDELVRVLHNWNRFRSTTFVAFVLGAARHRTQQDTHPFRVRYARRDWVLTHNGTLRGFREKLPLGRAPLFEPVGKTDSEHALCWIVSRLHEAGARTLAEYGWPRLHQLCLEINALGTANLVLSDGVDLVAFHDVKGFHEMYWTRRLPTAPSDVLLGMVALDLVDACDRNRTVVLFSSRPPEEEAWARMRAGQMLVSRGAEISWDSAFGSKPPPRRQVATVALRPVSAGDGPETTTASQGGAATRISRRIAENGAVKEIPTVPEAPPDSNRAAAEDGTSRLDPTVHPEIPQAAIRAYRPPRRARRGREYHIHHETLYRYESAVQRSVHTLRLLPIHDHIQELMEYSLEVNVAGVHRSFEDVFGNQSVQIDIEQPFHEMHLVSRAIVRVHARAYDALEFPNRRMSIPLVWMPWQRQMMSPYLLPPELPETQLLELSEFAMAAAERCDFDVLQTVVDLNQTIFQDFEYVPGSTSLATTPYDVFCTRRGVCQDFANLLICLARLLGVPARYRVGYIFTGAEYANQAQSEASHAWVELYLPWIGWRGFDPTNGYMVGADHIRVACGRNYRDATPTSGTIFKGGGGEQMTVSVRVETPDM